MFGTQRITLPPNHLVVFWAAHPHGPIETTPGGWAYGIHLPLPWVLQWGLPPLLMRRLLAGEILIDPPGDRPAADLDWSRTGFVCSKTTRKNCVRSCCLRPRAGSPPGGRPGSAETVAVGRKTASPFSRNARPFRADGDARGHALPRAADDRRHCPGRPHGPGLRDARVSQVQRHDAPRVPDASPGESCPTTLGHDRRDHRPHCRGERFWVSRPASTPASASWSASRRRLTAVLLPRANSGQATFRSGSGNPPPPGSRCGKLILTPFLPAK